jgi:magnesium-transporting ATPase (P-type)
MASVIKDWIEDSKRASNDFKQNSQKVLRADPVENEFVSDTWQNLKVGQIIKVLRDQVIPADLLLLAA